MATNTTAAKRHKAGLCRCGKKPEDPAYVSCLTCRIKGRKYHQNFRKVNLKGAADIDARRAEKRHKNRAAGLCWCGKETFGDYAQCKRHLWGGGKKLPKFITGVPRKPQPPYKKPLKHGGLSRTEVRRQWASEGLCYYCGAQRAEEKNYCTHCQETVNRFHANAKAARKAAREE